MVLLLSKTTRIWKQNKWCQFLEPGKNSIIFFDRILSCEWAIFGAQTSRFDMDIIHGWVRFGNPDFGFCNRTRNPKTDFTFEKSVLRVNFIKKSKSGFHGFPFYRLIGKSVKGFAKLFSWTTVLFLLIMRTRARTLFLRAVFRILFRISQSNGKKEIQKLISQRWNPVLDFAFYCKSEIRILKSKSRFPNRTPAPYIEKTWYKIPS